MTERQVCFPYPKKRSTSCSQRGKKQSNARAFSAARFHRAKPSEFCELMQSYLAANMDSLTVNRDKTIRSRRKHRDNHVAPAGEEKFLRYLGAAVIMRWNTIPTKLQRELFEHASTLDELRQMPSHQILYRYCLGPAPSLTAIASPPRGHTT